MSVHELPQQAKATIVLPVRRLGSDVVHLVRDPDTFPALVFKHPCTGVVTPVTTLCYTVLRGEAIVMHGDARASRRSCRRCVRANEEQ